MAEQALVLERSKHRWGRAMLQPKAEFFPPSSRLRLGTSMLLRIAQILQHDSWDLKEIDLRDWRGQSLADEIAADSERYLVSITSSQSISGREIEEASSRLPFMVVSVRLRRGATAGDIESLNVSRDGVLRIKSKRSQEKLLEYLGTVYGSAVEA